MFSAIIVQEPLEKNQNSGPPQFFLENPKTPLKKRPPATSQSPVEHCSGHSTANMKFRNMTERKVSATTCRQAAEFWRLRRTNVWLRHLVLGTSRRLWGQQGRNHTEKFFSPLFCSYCWWQTLWEHGWDGLICDGSSTADRASAALCLSVTSLVDMLREAGSEPSPPGPAVRTCRNHPNVLWHTTILDNSGEGHSQNSTRNLSKAPYKLLYNINKQKWRRSEVLKQKTKWIRKMIQ